MKEIRAVSGDLPGPGGAALSLAHSPCAGILPSHKLQLHKHRVPDDGMGRVWADSPASDTTPQRARGVWPDTPAL